MVQEVTSKPNFDGFSEEELSQITNDIKKAREGLVSKEVEQKINQVKEEAKREVEKEFLMNDKIKQAEMEKAQLQAEMEKIQKQSAEELERLKSKVDELISSKAPVKTDDPFKKHTDIKNSIDFLSDEQVSDIEEASARAFWGDEAYEDMKRH